MVKVVLVLVQVVVTFCTSLCARVPCGLLACCLFFCGWAIQFQKSSSQVQVQQKPSSSAAGVSHMAMLSLL
jgi:hypothetical protein